MTEPLTPENIVLVDGCPSLFCNPFKSDCIDSINICISKKYLMIQKGFPIVATIRMSNNNTDGQQAFYGDNLMSVMKQVDTFIKQISEEK